jgi:hypothetical protein
MMGGRSKVNEGKLRGQTTKVLKTFVVLIVSA